VGAVEGSRSESGGEAAFVVSGSAARWQQRVATSHRQLVGSLAPLRRGARERDGIYGDTVTSVVGIGSFVRRKRQITRTLPY